MDLAKPQQRKIPRQTLFRDLPFDRAAINAEQRTVSVSFSSETDQVLRWGEPEILDHAAGSADLTRLGSFGVVLFNHNPDLPIGRVENARIENGRGVANLVFDEDEAADKIFRKVLSGTLKGISVSYTYDDYCFLGENETSADGRFKGPCLLVKRWTALEISVVSVPADTSVGIGRAAGQDYRQLAAAVLDGLVERVRSNPAAADETAAPSQTENRPPEPDRAAELVADLFWIDSIT